MSFCLCVEDKTWEWVDWFQLSFESFVLRAHVSVLRLLCDFFSKSPLVNYLLIIRRGSSCVMAVGSEIVTGAAGRYGASDEKSSFEQSFSQVTWSKGERDEVREGVGDTKGRWPEDQTNTQHILWGAMFVFFWLSTFLKKSVFKWHTVTVKTHAFLLNWRAQKSIKMSSRPTLTI